MNDRNVRLQVFLSRSGLGSRRRCERIVEQGRVEINGRPVSELGVKVKPGDEVRVDGRTIEPQSPVYIALHKPAGCLCSNSDPHGRPLAIDYIHLPVAVRIFHVGRLDYNSSGLILYTNDGRFALRVAHPSYGVEKTYLVEACRAVDKSDLERYRSGLTIEGESYRLLRYRIRGPRTCFLTLLEGKNREIRRVFDHLGYDVDRIHRVRIGPVSLGDLQPGTFRQLSRCELDWFWARKRRPGAQFPDRH